MADQHTTNFERAIFFSWHCDIRDCAFCYMSTQQNLSQKPARRSPASILAEVLITKKLGWDMGFLSGGIGAYKKEEFRELLRKISLVSQEKIWINVGPLGKAELQEYLPYIKGVVGSVETVNPTIHAKLCPSKPIAPYLDMFREAEKLGLKNAVTIIIGLGETIGDVPLLFNIIRKYHIAKLHFYSLNPQKATIFEHTLSPSPEYQAEWIKRTRKAFPDLDIQCGIWEDKVDRVGLLLSSGANSISKFPAIKLFGGKQATELENQVRNAGYRFRSSLTTLPDIDWQKQVEAIPFEKELKIQVLDRLLKYLKTMQKKK